MTADEMFSISVLDAGLEVMRHCQHHPGCTYTQAIEYLATGPCSTATLDFRRASLVAGEADWSVFFLDPHRQVSLRRTLLAMATRFKPFWSRFAHLGRQRVLRLATPNQLQCLEHAGLLGDVPADDVVAWWEQLGALARQEEDRRLAEIGRTGEARTIAYEIVRMAAMSIAATPKLISIENQLAGYDVLSYDRLASGELVEVQIEVKTSTFEPLHFFLSRNEWKVATSSTRRHIFHIWGPDSSKPLVLDVGAVEAHIPVDQDSGKWDSVLITLSDATCQRTPSAES